MRSLLEEQSGSVVVVIVFAISIIAFGFIYTMVNYAVEEVAAETTTTDSTFVFLVWFWGFGIIIVAIIASVTWLVSQLQKSKYTEER